MSQSDPRSFLQYNSKILLKVIQATSCISCDFPNLWFLNCVLLQLDLLYLQSLLYMLILDLFCNKKCICLLQVHIAFPVFFMIIMTFLILFPLFYSPFECLMGLFMVATGIPVYCIGVLWRSKPKVFSSWIGKRTFLSSVPSFKQQLRK